MDAINDYITRNGNFNANKLSNENQYTNGYKKVSEKEHYTPEQKEKIKELRERVLPSLVRPEQEEDAYLIKWLIARNFDVNKAEVMLKKHIRFGKAHGIEAVLNGDYKPPEACDYFFSTMLGYDHEGSVVRLLNVGASDLRGLCMSISKVDCVRYASYVLYSDYLKQLEDRKNDSICDKQVYILDLQGLSIKTVIQRIVIDRAYTLLRLYEANHPERLKVAYVVNVPTFFSFIFNWLKTVLPDSIISKLEIMSTDEVKSKLPKKVDPSILPAYLGGTRRDPDGDEKCKTLFPKPLGAPVPEHLMPAEQMQILKNDSETTTVTIEAKSQFIAEKLVTEPFSTLLWDFQTVDYDIRVGLRYKENENSVPEKMITIHRVDSHLIPEAGTFICEKPGIYEMVFDNTYSWMTKKELLFKIRLLPPL